MPSTSPTKNWRFNPFTETSYPKTISGEACYPYYFEEFNAYGFITEETPKKESPSTFVLYRSGNPVAFQEVAQSTTPGVGQYRVDYDSTLQYATGFVELNQSDCSGVFLASYRGLGATVKYNESVWQGIPALAAHVDIVSGQLAAQTQNELQSLRDDISRIPTGWEFLGQVNTWGGASHAIRAIAPNGSGTIVVGVQDTNARLFRSTDDGATWTEPTQPGTGTLITSLKYSNGIFVGAGNVGLIASTDNGATWSSTYTSGVINSARYLGGQWLATSSVPGYVLTSANGLTWTVHTPSNVSCEMIDVAYGDGVYVLAGYDAASSNDGRIYTSTDAVTWTQRTISNSTYVYGVSFHPETDTFVAVGHNTVSNQTGVWTSTDSGVTWINQPFVGSPSSNFGFVAEYGGGTIVFANIDTSANYSRNPAGGFAPLIKNSDFGFGAILEITYDPFEHRWYMCGTGAGSTNQWVMRSTVV